jgi:hypothetical protein
MGKGAHRVGARLGNLAATHKRKTQELTLGYLYEFYIKHRRKA